MRGIFFDEDDARAVVTRLRADGWEAELSRERLAGEDDDDDHPWAVVTDAAAFQLELLVEEYDGWLDADPGDGHPSRPGHPGHATPTVPPLELPTAPKRIKRGDQ